MKQPRFPVVYITDELARRTAALLGSFASRRPSEGVVYWFGIEAPLAAAITTLIVPDADTRDGSVRTSVHANAKAIAVITDTPLVYLSQAHSHPGRNVSHSYVDDHETFATFDGAISVVVPWFGRYGVKIQECAFYRHLDGKFRQIEDVGIPLSNSSSLRRSSSGKASRFPPWRINETSFRGDGQMRKRSMPNGTIEQSSPSTAFGTTYTPSLGNSPKT